MFIHNNIFCIALFVNRWFFATSLSPDCISDSFGVSHPGEVHYVLGLVKVYAPDAMKIPEDCSIKGVEAIVCTDGEDEKVDLEVQVRVISLYEVFVGSVKPVPVRLILYCLHKPDLSQVVEIPEIQIMDLSFLKEKESDISNVENQINDTIVPQDVANITEVPAINLSYVEDQLNVTTAPLDEILITVVPVVSVSKVENQSNLPDIISDVTNLTNLTATNPKNIEDRINLDDVSYDRANITGLSSAEPINVKNPLNLSEVAQDIANVTGKSSAKSNNVEDQLNLSEISQNAVNITGSSADKLNVKVKVNVTKVLPNENYATVVPEAIISNFENKVNFTEVQLDVANVTTVPVVNTDNQVDKLKPKMLQGLGNITFVQLDKPVNVGDQVNITKVLQVAFNVTFILFDKPGDVADQVNFTEALKDVADVTEVSVGTPVNIEDQAYFTKYPLI